MIYIKAIISTREKGFPGYTAGALFDCISHFIKNILERTSRNNLLVRACRLYLESDFVMAGLKAL